LEIGSFKIISELSEYGYRLSLLMKCFSLRLAYFFIVNLFFNAMMQNSRPIEASEGGSANGFMACSTSGTDVGNTVKSTSGDSGSIISTEEQRTGKDQGSNTPVSAIESNRSSGSP